MMMEAAGAAGADLIVHTDYVCPFCYLAEAALSPLRAEGLRIDARPFELFPAGTALPSLDDAYYRTTWEQGVAPLAEQLGVRGMVRPRFATRTRKAHEAMAFAAAHGRGDAMHRALFDAYFLEQRDIGRVDVLVSIGAALGFERALLKVALDVDKYADQVASQEAEAMRLGIRAVPAYLAPTMDDHYRLMLGVRASEDVRAFLSAGAGARVAGDDE